MHFIIIFIRNAFHDHINPKCIISPYFYRFVEKGNLEIMLFTLQSQMRANNQKPYLPKEGKLISDINKAWEALERAEHERELALREELIRYDRDRLCGHLIAFAVFKFWFGIVCEYCRSKVTRFLWWSLFCVDEL